MTIINGNLVYEDGRSMMVDQIFVKEDVQTRENRLFIALESTDLERVGTNRKKP